MGEAPAITVIWIFVLVSLLFFSSVASYLRLLMRRTTPMAGIRLFQPKEGHRIKVDRELVGISLSSLHGAGMALFAVGLAALFFLKRPQHFWGNVGASLVTVLLAVAVCDQLIPFVLVARRGEPESVLKGWLPLLRLA